MLNHQPTIDIQDLARFATSDTPAYRRLFIQDLRDAGTEWRADFSIRNELLDAVEHQLRASNVPNAFSDTARNLWERAVSMQTEDHDSLQKQVYLADCSATLAFTQRLAPQLGRLTFVRRIRGGYPFDLGGVHVLAYPDFVVQSDDRIFFARLMIDRKELTIEQAYLMVAGMNLAIQQRGMSQLIDGSIVISPANGKIFLDQPPPIIESNLEQGCLQLEYCWRTEPSHQQHTEFVPRTISRSLSHG